MSNMIRMNELSKRLSVSKSTLYLWIKKGLFPSPIKVGENTVVWSEEQIQDWLLNKSKEEE